MCNFFALLSYKIKQNFKAASIWDKNSKKIIDLRKTRNIKNIIMKKYIPIISTAVLFASASVATAATAIFNFSASVGDAENPVNVWDAVSAESEYGAFSGNDPTLFGATNCF